MRKIGLKVSWNTARSRKNKDRYSLIVYEPKRVSFTSSIQSSVSTDMRYQLNVQQSEVDTTHTHNIKTKDKRWKKSDMIEFESNDLVLLIINYSQFIIYNLLFIIYCTHRTYRVPSNMTQCKIKSLKDIRQKTKDKRITTRHVTNTGE